MNYRKWLPIAIIGGVLLLLAVVATAFIILRPDSTAVAGSSVGQAPNVTPVISAEQAALNDMLPVVGGNFWRSSLNPAPLPAPPATTEPARLLASGEDFLAQERFMEAAAQFRLIIDRYSTSSEFKVALYNAGKAATGRGRTAEASDFFKKYLVNFPNDVRQPECLYQLGLLARQLNNPAEATTFFQQYLDLKDSLPLDGYAYYELAQMLRSAGKLSQASDTFKKAAESNVALLIRVNSYDALGDIASQAGLHTEAAGWYGKLIEISRVRDYRAGIITKQVRSYELAGQSAKANELNLSLVNEYVDTPTGFNTLRNLFNATSPLLTDYHRGYFLVQAGNPTAAITALTKALNRPDEKSVQPILPGTLLAITAEQTARSWFYLAVAYENKNDLPRAIVEYTDLTAKLPGTTLAPRALYRLAGLQERQNQPDEASATFTRLADNYPKDDLAEAAAFSVVRLAQLKGLDTARPVLDKFAARFPGSRNLPQQYYQLGKFYQDKNDANQARAAFERAISTVHFDYYTARSIERLNQLYNPNQPPRSMPETHPAVYNQASFAATHQRERTELDTWLKGWAISGTETVDTLRNTVINDAGTKRLDAWSEIGNDTYANREAREAYDRYTDRPAELAYVALYLNEKGNFNQSWTAATRLLELYRQKFPDKGLRDMPKVAQKLLYPLAFNFGVLEQARRYNFDPLAYLSLIRQESLYLPTAASSASARGLTQVIPGTGTGIASALGKPDFEVDDLYYPYTSLEFGAFFFNNQLNNFKGNLYVALTAYNGGPGNAARWIKTIIPETNFDRWLESIDYAETRGYVQAIYANYYQYRQLYAQ